MLPRPAEITGICITYLVLTVALRRRLWPAGMTCFEAVVHAMTTISTGGFSTPDDSIGAFQEPLIEWILIVFMLGGALAAAVVFPHRARRAPTLWRDSQVRCSLDHPDRDLARDRRAGAGRPATRPFFDALRLGPFNVVSVMTTTGFATTDYNPWGGFATAVIFILTFVGGCAGSTAGGIKVFRLQVMGRRCCATSCAA